MRRRQTTVRPLLLCALATLALVACSTKDGPQVVPEVRVETFRIPPELRRCEKPAGLTAGQIQADIGRDLVTVTESLVACAVKHDRLVAAIEAPRVPPD